MNGAVLHLALRELRGVYGDPRALSVIGLVGVLMGLVGPFGTFEMLPGPVLVLYWTAIAFVTYGAGLVGSALASAVLAPQRRPLWRHVLAGSLGAALPVTLAVVAINRLFFGEAVFVGFGVVVLFAYCLGISLVLIVLLEMVAPLFFARPEAESPHTPELMRRLPPQARASLTHLSMADHYVEVHTEKGCTLVLMRFADAVRETEGTPGLQIHRSHWVAREAVAGLVREKGRTLVALKDGTRLPVSRRFLGAARAVFD